MQNKITKYSVKKLSDLAGVSVRTLHIYDEKGLLKPSERSKSGHRIYGRLEFKRLQKILFYKNLGFSLDEIKEMLFTTDWQRLKALRNQKELLIHQFREQEKRLHQIEEAIEKLSLENQLPYQQRLKKSAA